MSLLIEIAIQSNCYLSRGRPSLIALVFGAHQKVQVRRASD